MIKEREKEKSEVRKRQKKKRNNQREESGCSEGQEKVRDDHGERGRERG